MRIPRIIIASLSLALLCISSATVTYADTITFTGTLITIDNPPPAADPVRCGAPPNVLVTLNPSTGTSNLGSFTSTNQSQCNNVGNIFNGLFSFDFGAGNTFFGTYVGTITLPPVGGVAPFAETFTLTGGTGLFSGASGTLIATGTVTFNANGPDAIANFNGTINTVPEPTTLFLLSTGLAGVGAAVRKRRKSRHSEGG